MAFCFLTLVLIQNYLSPCKGEHGGSAAQLP